MYASRGGKRRARLGGDEYTFPGTPASFPGLGTLGAVQGEADPVNGSAYTWDNVAEDYVRFESSIGQNVTAAWDQARASYPENPFANMTELQKAQYIAGKYGVDAAANLSAVYQPVGGVIDPVAAQAAAASFIANNQTAISNVVTAVETAQAAHIAAASYENDYIARSGGDLATWYALSNPGAERYTMASNGGALLDNALLQYTALKSAGAPGISALDASAAAADADRAAAYQASLSTGGFTSGMVAPGTAQAAVQAISEAGGDPTQWTGVIDSNTGATIALVRQAADGSIVSAPATGSSRDLASVAQTVTGFIDRAAGTIQNIGTQVQKVGNAIKGAEAGATAGWNLSPNAWKYAAAGGALLVAVMIFRPSHRR